MKRVERVGIERWGSDREESEWVEMVGVVDESVECMYDDVLKKEERKVERDREEEVIVEIIGRGVRGVENIIGELEVWKYEERKREGKFSGEDRWNRIEEWDNEMMFL